MIDPSQATWAQIFAAIEAAITTLTGLTVIWSWQNYNAPPLNYVRVGIGSAATVGQDWIQEWQTGSSTPNEEFALTVGGLREVALQIEAFSASTVETEAAATSLSIVDTVTAGLYLPSIRAALNAVGFTPFAPGPTNYIPDVVSTGFRGRAVCDVRSYLPARMVEEYATFIASVALDANVSGTGNGTTIDVPITAN